MYIENEILINSKKPVIVECFLIPPYSIYTQFNSYILVPSLVNVVKNIQDKKRLRETEKKNRWYLEILHDFTADYYYLYFFAFFFIIIIIWQYTQTSVLISFL